MIYSALIYYIYITHETFTFMFLYFWYIYCINNKTFIYKFSMYILFVICKFFFCNLSNLCTPCGARTHDLQDQEPHALLIEPDSSRLNSSVLHLHPSLFSFHISLHFCMKWVICAVSFSCSGFLCPCGILFLRLFKKFI